MRIEPTGTIRVSGKSGVFDHLGDIKKGAELPAKIVSRISGREAVCQALSARASRWSQVP